MVCALRPAGISPFSLCTRGSGFDPHFPPASTVPTYPHPRIPVPEASAQPLALPAPLRTVSIPRDLEYFAGIKRAIVANSNSARVFCLVHKMDLVQVCAHPYATPTTLTGS